MRLLTLLILFSNCLTSQTMSDSMFNELRINIEEKAISIANYDKNYSDSLVKYAISKKSDKLLAEAYCTKAFVVMNDNYDSALYYNTISFNINLTHNNKKELAKNYFNFGSFYFSKSDYIKAMDYFLKSLDIAIEFKMKVWMQKNYRMLSSLLIAQQNFPKAISYAKKATDLNKQNTGNLLLLASAYLSNSQIDSAAIIYKQAYELSEKINNKAMMGEVLTMWSLIYDEADVIKSIELKLQARKILQDSKPISTAMINTLANLGWMHYQLAINDSLLRLTLTTHLPHTKKQLLDSAEWYYKQALWVGEKNNDGNITGKLNFIKELAKVQAYKGNYNDAYKNLLESMQLNDSVFSQENKNAIAKIESQKEIDLKNKELELNLITLQNKETQKHFYIAGLFILSIIGFLLFYQNMNRKRTNQTLLTLNTELEQANKIKARFFSILNHDLRSPVANIIHFLHLQRENTDVIDEATKKRLEHKTISSAENLLISMEDILLWSKGQMENFQPIYNTIVINELFEDIKNHFSSVENCLIIFENPQNIILHSDVNCLKTIIRNLTDNAVKVLKKTADATITVKAWKLDDNSFLSITDNGLGASKENLKALYNDEEIAGINTGLGFHLIKDLAKFINCKISVNSFSNRGTSFILCFN